MTELYPPSPLQLSPPEASASRFGSGILLPNPGSPRVVGANNVPEYEKYIGVRLLASEHLAAAVVSKTVSLRANELGVELQLGEGVVEFKPPTSGEAARALGSLIRQSEFSLRNNDVATL
jgi:hypothetical protein